MIHVALPSTLPQMRLPFYLAVEEWVALTLPPAEYFFTWTSDPTVIYGRNQDMATELDKEYCENNGIQYYRRKSGGGCVYSDRHNIMTSYVAPAENVATTFSRYTGLLAQALRNLGLDASATGRNDVLIGDRKVSGCAFYHIPGRSIAHGTMLYSTNMKHMLNAITPSRSKLESKQVQSVQSRITTLSEHLPDMPMDEFRRYLIGAITDSEIALTDQQIEAVRHIEAAYYRPEWIFGRRKKDKGGEVVIAQRVEGCGNLKLCLHLSPSGIITDADLTGDFFHIGDVEALLGPLHGIKQSDCAQALRGIDASRVISGLTTEQLVDLIKN